MTRKSVTHKKVAALALTLTLMLTIGTALAEPGGPKDPDGGYASTTSFVLNLLPRL